jgi:hypothetical protein
MLLTGAAMLVLVNATAGSSAALLTVALLFLLPDPSCWIPDSKRQNSYFFFQQVGVGGAYAVAIMGWALAYALRGFQIASWRFCFLSLSLFAVAGLFKIQIFLAYSFFFGLFVIWNAPWPSRWLRLLCGVVFAAVFFFALSKMAQVANAPTMAISSAGLRTYLEPNLRSISAVFGPLPIPPSWVLMAVAPLKLFAVTYGILFPVSAYLAWKLRKHRAARITAWLLVFWLTSHAIVRLLIADNQGFGDRTEVNTKTLVWPYFVVVYCSGVLMWSYVAAANFGPAVRKWLPVPFAGCLLLFSGAAATRLQTWPSLSEMLTRTPSPKGLFESAAYLRKESLPLEVVQLCENDNLNQLATLAERPVYIAKLWVNAPAENPTERKRFAAVQRILDQRDFQGAKSLMRQADILWFLMTPTCRATWEPEVSPVLSSGGYRLYQIGS